MITYRRRRPGETEWRIIEVRESKRIDQMSREELHAEMVRRLPCCAPEPAPFHAAQDAKTEP